MKLIKSSLKSYALSIGVYRGLFQIPFHLGVTLLALSLGENAVEAIAKMLAFVHGVPRFFSFIFEVWGGVIAHRIGSRGSFVLLPIALFFRMTSLLLQGCIFFISDLNLLIGGACLAVIISEIGRSLESGAFEDAYRQSSKVFLEEANSYEMIASLDVLKTKMMRYSQLIFAFLGTSVLLISFNFSSLIFTSIIFFVGATLFLKAFKDAVIWLKWADKNIAHSKSIEDIGCIKSQLKYFFRSPDLLSCMGTGGIEFLFISLISFSAITTSGLVESAANGSIGLDEIFIGVALSGLLPLSSLLGLKLIKINRENEFFNKMIQYKGILALMLWGSIVSLYSYFGPWEAFSIPFTFLLAMIISPFRTWYEWLRVYFIKNAEDKNVRIFGSTHAFYYSLVSGCREMFLGIFSVVPQVLLLMNVSHRLTHLVVLGFSSLFLIIWNLSVYLSSEKLLGKEAPS